MSRNSLTRSSRLWPRRKETPLDGFRYVLRIEHVDLCFHENGQQFHTEMYELMAKSRPAKRPRQLVVRRGAPFTVRLLCDRKFDRQTDTMMLMFSAVPFAAEVICYGNGTEVYVPLSTRDDSGSEPTGDDWEALLTHTVEKPSGETELVLAITTPTTAPIARWKLEIHCRLDTTDQKSIVKNLPLIYLLYNPWCEADTVYLADEAARKEYVLNDSTLIWKRTLAGFHKQSWYLGQYETNILDITLYVLTVVGRVTPTFSGNPVQVSRALAGALNTRACHGVLEGNWTGNYENGHPPSFWSGSVKILQQFYRTRKPVQYGQCWVYAGLLGTVCRAIGLPCRLVSNFQSGCDFDSSLTVDLFLDDKDSFENALSDESLWNYHVFNEVWMKRPDLQNASYDGWQVIDSTPQRLSDGLYRVGPCPVEAVRQGNVHVPYDAGFVYSEVNANVVLWTMGNSRSPPKPIDIVMNLVGKDLSTKAIGSDARVDVTERYKHPKGSDEERKVMLATMKRTCQRYSNAGLGKKLLCELHTANEALRGISAIKLQLKADSELVYGATFKIELTVTNMGMWQSREVTGKLVLKCSDYTGRRSETVKKFPFYVRLDPDEFKSYVILVHFEQYFRLNADQSTIQANCTAEVKGSDRTYYVRENFPITLPPISMSLVTNGPGEQLVIQVEFTNPLPIPLWNGRFLVEGSRFTEPLEKKYDLIPVGETVQFLYPINVSQRGRMVISASFVSEELQNVDGYIVVNIP